MTKRKEPRGGSESPVSAFRPAMLRSRQDGWTADRQVDFIQALAECGCVREACARVGMATSSAYALRARLDAQSFRYAWDTALDHAVQRLSDAAFSRALNGVSRPVFFQGEQIGERRHYDERLTMFLLRYRDPVRYGKFNDALTSQLTHPDSPALRLAQLLLEVLKDGNAFDISEAATGDRPEMPVSTIVEEVERLVDQLHGARGSGSGGGHGAGIDADADWLYGDRVEH